MIMIILIAIAGLCIGSFISMASYRLALINEGLNKNIRSLMIERSACTKCGTKLKIKNLIPIFSWLIQKGRCSVCHSKISCRYALIEFFTMSIFLMIYFWQEQVIDIELLMLLIMASLLMIMIVTDLENYFIPDITQIILTYVVIIYHLVTQDFHLIYYFGSAALFVFLALSLYYGFIFFAKKQAIGIDDIKFFAVAGLLIGINQLPLFMMLTGISGIIFGLIWKKLTKDETFPFAPALAISLMVCLLLKDKISYLNLGL